MLSIVGELSWSWIPKDHVQVQNEKENFVVACLRSQQNVKLGISPRSRAVTGKKVRCTCCFAN